MRFGNTNPVIRSVANRSTYAIDGALTYSSVGLRTFLLLLITGGVGIYTYANLATVLTWPMLIGAFILAFVSAMIGTYSVKLSPIFSVIYAASEGFVLAFLSALYASSYEGIVPTAISTTFVVLLITLLLYSSGIVKVTAGFSKFLVIGLISVMVMALLSFVLPFTGGLYYLAVGLSALISVLFLFYDFETIKTCVDAGTDKSYSWVLALGLMVTLVWVYVEILRLLAIFAGRRR